MNRRQAARPKRAGEDFARAHLAGQDEDRASKKLRFDTRNPATLAADAPEEDAVLDADEIGRRGPQTKRNAVNIDGYASDSSNEDRDARAEAKTEATKDGAEGATGSKDEEEDDMFADFKEEQAPNGAEEDDMFGEPEEKELPDEDKDDDVVEREKRKREAIIANIDKEVTGQFAVSKSGVRMRANILANPRDKGTDDVESGSSDDDEAADERRAALEEGMDEEVGAGGKKDHAPRLEAFNLAEEKAEGGFDEQHNFIRKAADPDAVYDNWLAGTNKKDVRRAQEAQERREREQRQKAREDDEVLTADILRNLIPHIQKGETVIEALARLGRGKSAKTSKVPKWKSKKKSSAMEVDDAEAPKPQEDDEAEKQRRLAVEAITDSADRLMRRGEEDIYEEEREVLMRLYKRETGEDWVGDPTSSGTAEVDPAAQWEYRWSDGRDGDNIHGPYDGTTMHAWNDAGYFVGEIEFRPAGSGDHSWSSVVQFI